MINTAYSLRNFKKHEQSEQWMLYSRPS